MSHKQKTGMKKSFETSQASQMKIFESFKSRLQRENEEQSIDECESVSNNQTKLINKLGSFGQDDELRSDFRYPNQRIKQVSSFLNQSKDENGIFQSHPDQAVEEEYQKNNISSMRSFKNIQEKNKQKIEDEKGSKSSFTKSLSCSDIQDNKFVENKNSNDIQSKAHLINDKSPVSKNYARRGSRKIPNMNLSLVVKEQDQGIFQMKGGFFFALKMKKFANQLVSRLQSRRYLSLRAKHLKFFNDGTIIPDEEKGIFKQQNEGEEHFTYENQDISIGLEKRISFFFKNLYSKFISKKMKKTLEKIPLFQPSNTYKLLWDFLNMLSIAYFLIFYPLRITFGLEMYSTPISLIALIIILADILVHLNSGFYDKGSLVTERLQIIFNYIKQRIWRDLISLLPFIFYDFSNQNMNMLSNNQKLLESSVSILFLIRIGHLSQIKKKIEERFYQKKTLTHFFSLFSLLVNTLYIAHLFSCAWIIVGKFQASENTWMTQANVDQEDWTVQYLYSLYFLIITMTTVGYGDIRAQSSIEHLFIIVIVLISSGVFSFSINQIGHIVSQITAEKEKVKQTLQVINNYMHKKNINVSLQQQIREYLEYYLKESIMNDNETEGKTIDMLSEPLKKQLMIEANKIALKDSPIFRNNFSDSTITKTVALIQELRCTPEEVLFYEGDSDDSAIFFVQQGKVEMFIDSYKSNEVQITSLKVFSKGSSFGEICFFTGLPRSMSIRSIDFTTLLMIKRQDFLNVVKESSEDYEKFCKIKDSISFYKNYKEIGVLCHSCSSKSHVLNDCPLIHYIPDFEKKPDIIERQQFVHQRSIKMNAFENIYPMREEAKLFQINNATYFHQQDWYDETAEMEDEEEYDILQKYDDQADEDIESEGENLKRQNSGKNNTLYKSQYTETRGHVKKFDTYDVNVASPNRQDSSVSQTKDPSRVKEETNVGNLNNLSVNHNTNFESYSLKSGYKSIHNEGDEKPRERVPSSHLGINDLTITPSGLLINLINPNPGSIKENSQKGGIMQIRKRSVNSNQNQNQNQYSNPQNKFNTLQEEQSQLSQSSFVAIGPNAQQNNLDKLAPVQGEKVSGPLRRQASYQMKNNQYSKIKVTEKTSRSNSKKLTLESKTAGYNNWIQERRPFKRMTSMKLGASENQIQNTLLALQGMENMIFQSKAANSNEQEFDVMKSFEIYFPHNNIDIVLFKLKKSKPMLYFYQKSLGKKDKRLIKSMTINSKHGRMSKMDMVLQKFLMSEVDEEREDQSARSRIKSQGFKTPKANQQQQEDSLSQQQINYNNNRKRRTVADREWSPQLIHQNFSMKSEKYLQIASGTLRDINEPQSNRMLKSKNDDEDTANEKDKGILKLHQINDVSEGPSSVLENKQFKQLSINRNLGSTNNNMSDMKSNLILSSFTPINSQQNSMNFPLQQRASVTNRKDNLNEISRSPPLNSSFQENVENNRI